MLKANAFLLAGLATMNKIFLCCCMLLLQEHAASCSLEHKNVIKTSILCEDEQLFKTLGNNNYFQILLALKLHLR